MGNPNLHLHRQSSALPTSLLKTARANAPIHAAPSPIAPRNKARSRASKPRFIPHRPLYIFIGGKNPLPSRAFYELICWFDALGSSRGFIRRYRVSFKPIPVLAILLLPATAWPRQEAPLSAKTLYYQSDPDEDTQTAKTQTKTKTKATAAKHAASPSTAVQLPKQNGAVATAAPVGQYLGLRYNIFLFDRKSSKSVPVDRDRQFQPDECIQLEFTPNRSGYLYIFQQGSSGNWQVLFPSSLMTDEVNDVKARQSVKVPANYCFRIGNPPGTEHLFVVLSRNQEDMHSLDRAIRARSQNPATPTAPQTEISAAALSAESNLGAEIQRIRSELGAKDMSIEKIGEPDQPGEPENAVYVVNASNVSSDRLVSEILIRHD